MGGDKSTKKELLEEIALLRMRVEELEAAATSVGVDAARPLSGAGAADEDETSAKYRALFTNPDAPMLFVDASSKRFVDVNPAFEKLYGCTRDELLGGMTVLDVSDEPDKTLVSMDEITGGDFVVVPLRRHKKKDGAVFPVEIIAGLIRYGGDMILYGIVKDLTARIRDENRLRETTALFQSLVNTMPDIVYFKDREGRNLMVNWAFEEFSGKTAKEIAGKTDNEIFPPALAEACRKSDEEVMRTGNLIRVEENAGGEGEAEVFFETVKAPVMDDLGNITGLLGMSRDITARKIAAGRLAESERRFREVLENVRLIAVILDTQGDISFCNEFLLELTGWTRDEVIGRNWFDIFIPPESGEVKEMFNGAIKTGSLPAHHVSDIVTRSGERRAIAWNNTALRGPAGDCVGTTSLGEDVTERKLAEEKLVEAQLWLVEAQRAASLGIYMYDLKAGTWTSSIVLDEIFGIDTTYEKTTESWLGLIPPEDRENASEYIRKVISEKTLFDMTDRIVRACDGNIRWVRGLGQLILDKNGVPEKLVGTIQDVTGQKRMNDALKESEQRHRALIEYSVDHIYMLDKDGVYLSSNNHYNSAGLQDDMSLVGFSIEGIYDYKTLPMFKAMMAETLATGKSVTFEHTVDTAAGVRHHIATLYPIMQDGEAVAIGGICRDITDNKRMTEEISKSQKIESIGMLAGGIAHDFNNFLAAILGGIDYAVETLDEEPREALGALEQARKAIIEARGLTQQLLTFSKGGAPVKKPGPISALLRETAEFTLRGSKSSCEFAISPDLWNADMDSGQISRVIQNIVINADQAMPGGGSVKVTAANEEIGARSVPPLGPGKYIKVTISDNGPGIKEADLPFVFDPYFSTKKKGQGLGLATSFSIISKHAGHITAASGPGRGASIIFYLPATERQNDAHHGAGKGARANLKILIMDDQALITDLLKKHFDRVGYSAAVAPDGQAAINMYSQAMAEGEPFDAVVLDLTIPGGMGGEEAMRRLLEIDPGVRAIVASGYFSDPVMANFEKYGFKGVAEKPYFFDELCKKIQTVVAENP